MKTKDIVGVGLLTAIVIVLQMIGAVIRFGPFSITLTLVPIIVGAALYGAWAGGWLGFVFGMVVLFTDAGAFLAVNPVGTVITVLAKGACCGIAAGWVYRALRDKGQLPAVICAGITAPVVNTGLFLIGCLLFFMPTINGWAEAAGFPSGGNYLIFGMVGTNFIVEMIINLVLGTVIVKILGLSRLASED